jgi:hypothetical protein
MVARLKVFARFQTAEEHEALVDGILKARRLKNQIEILQLYRSMGIRSIEQARVYESDRKRREQDSKSRKARESTSYLYEGSAGLSFDAAYINSTSAKQRMSGGKRGGLSTSDSVSTGLGEADETTLDDNLSRAPGAGKNFSKCPL